MSWIGVSTGRRKLSLPKDDTSDRPSLYSIGTLTVETTYAPESGSRQIVLDLQRHVGWHRGFSISLGPNGDVLLEHRQADRLHVARLDFARPDPDSILQITYSWHAPERIGLLSIENLSTGDLMQTACLDPLPWPADDLNALIAGADGCHIDPNLTLVAASSRVEPVGFATGFAAQTRINTLVGPKPASALRPGDLLPTADHGVLPVRHIIRQSRPATGHFAPIRLRAPFFGLTRDLLVSPDHRLLITGVDAEYLFGADSVLVEARHLAKMAADTHASTMATVEYVQIVMDAHVCLSAQGTWAESLYLGNLADLPSRHATSPLAGIAPDDLPRHSRMNSPDLRGYEAMVLVSAMCA